MTTTAEKNPLRPLAVVAGFSITWDTYDFIARHHANSIAMLRTPLFLLFITLYLLNFRAAWIAAFAAFIAITPLYVCGEYLRSQPPNLAVILIFVIATFGGILFLVRVRKQYDSYIEQRSRQL
jgi:hypothetical protein